MHLSCCNRCLDCGNLGSTWKFFLHIFRNWHYCRLSGHVWYREHFRFVLHLLLLKFLRFFRLSSSFGMVSPDNAKKKTSGRLYFCRRIACFASLSCLILFAPFVIASICWWGVTLFSYIIRMQLHCFPKHISCISCSSLCGLYMRKNGTWHSILLGCYG